MKFLVCIAATVLLLFACADNGTPPPTPHDDMETVSVGDMLNQATGDVVIDLRKDGVVYQVDHGIKLDRVTLICPNEQTMPFASWVNLQSREFDIDYAGLIGGFAVLKGAKPGDKVRNTSLTEAVECPSGCRPCTDGGCICGEETN